MKAKERVSAILVLGVAAALLTAGCRASYLDPGANPARILIEIEARTNPVNLPRHHEFFRPLLWDWGLYLVPAHGPYLVLPPQGQQKLKAVAADPLVRRAVFLAPPGGHTLELSAQSYLLVPWHRVPEVWSVDYFQKQWKVTLAPGEAVTLRALFGPPVGERPPPELYLRQRGLYE